MKIGAGASQRRQGQQMLDDAVRPEYQLPKEILVALNRASNRMGDARMPGETSMLGEVNQQFSNVMESASISGNPFAAIATAQANASKARRDIGDMSARFRFQEDMNIQSLLETIGKYRDQEFQMNEFAPYAEKVQRASDLIGAGAKNINTGMTDITGLASVLSGLGGSSFGSMLGSQEASGAYSGFDINSALDAGSQAVNNIGQVKSILNMLKYIK